MTAPTLGLEVRGGVWRALLRRPAARVGLALAAALALAALLGPPLAADPDLPDYADQLAAPSAAHPLGTDQSGRDLLARSLAGAQTSLGAALLVMSIAAAVGLVVGTVAGSVGGRVDAVLTRLTDVLLGLPSLVLTLAVVGVLGPGFWNLVLAMSATSWAGLARLARSVARGSDRRPDVVAARMAGVGRVRVALGHVLPAAASQVTVAATLGLGETVLALGGLSFLGLGAQPPTAEWGNMLATGRATFAFAPWQLIGPGVGLVLTVTAAALISDALRDVTDPGAAGVTPLEITGLTVRYPGGCTALDGVDLTVGAGERWAVVGRSGSGKTTLVRAVLGLLPPGTHVSGSVRVGGREVLGASDAELRALRGLVVGYVPQDPFAACDPLRTVGHHVAQAWAAHRRRPPDGAVPTALEGVGIPDAVLRQAQHPHQWSGGMLQRATLVAATAHTPLLTLADEPTSALDAELADDVLDLVRRTCGALLLISHDLALVARHAGSVLVLDGGRVVERGAAATLLTAPAAPETRVLVAASAPEPRTAAGEPGPVVAGVRGVVRRYGPVTAVDGVDLDVRAGRSSG